MEDKHVHFFLGLFLGAILGIIIFQKIKNRKIKWVSCKELLPDEAHTILVKQHWGSYKEIQAVRVQNTWVYVSGMRDLISTSDHWRDL